MQPMCASFCVKMSEFVRNPAKVKNEAGLNPIAVLSKNTTAFYLVDPYIYDTLVQAAQSCGMPLPKSVTSSKSTSYVNGVVTNATENPLFSSLVPKMLELEKSRVRRGELTAKALKITGYRLEKHVNPFFGDMPIGSIQVEHLEEFISMLNDDGLGGVSIGQYLIIVRKVLKYAHSMRIITTLPTFPSVLAKRISRGSFTLDEYRKLLKTTWHLRDQSFKQRKRYIDLRTEGLNESHLIMSKEMRRLVGFMVNSFVRPSDIRLMQHKHIEVVERGNKYLRLSLPETKKHDKPIVSMRTAVGIYERHLADAKKNGYGRPDDYVFFPQFENRNYALRVMGFLFNWILEETDLKMGPHGTGRTLYSLRHTAITFRLLYGQGIDVLTLARNARTSVEMIERHYASTLNGEMNVSLIQSKRTTQR